MKIRKMISTLLLLAMLLTSVALPAFADDERTAAATEVIEMILGLDENTKPEQFAAVRSAYNALTDEEKATIYNYDSLVEFEIQYAIALNNAIAAINPLEIDLFNGESVVKPLVAKYEVLGDEAKALVTEYQKLKEVNEKIDKLRAWSENTEVNMLNSNMRGLAKYDFNSLFEASKTPSVGVYYFFEEAFITERGDPSTGYYDISPNNEKVGFYKYAKLEMDIKFTDLDFAGGFPALKTLVSNEEGTHWAAFDFVNNIYLSAQITTWSQGYFIKHTATEEGNIDLGVWHHMVFLWDHENISIELDGETVFETTYDGGYEFLILYPWACNLEMTNVVFTDGEGKEVLSPFKNAHNFPNWARASNEEGATMLDLIEEALGETRSRYNKLSDEEKAQVVDADQIDRVQAIIDQIRAGKFPLTIAGGTADKDFYEFNETVTVTADAAPEGKVFDKWVVEQEGMILLETVDPEEVPADLTKSTLSFAMPDCELTLTATYKDRPPFTAGDANGDEKLNAKDVTAIMKYLVNAAPSNFVEAAADYDGNGTINAKDVTKLMKYLVTNA